MSRWIALVTVLLVGAFPILSGCQASREQIDTGLYAARGIAQIAKDLGMEARVDFKVVPQARAGLYGPGVELDSRTEVDGQLTAVPARSGSPDVAPTEPPPPDEPAPEQPAADEPAGDDPGVTEPTSQPVE